MTSFSSIVILSASIGLFQSFFADWRQTNTIVYEATLKPPVSISADEMFDKTTLEAAHKRLKIRDLTSAITLQFFVKNFRKGEALLIELKALKPTNGIDQYFEAILDYEKGNFAAATLLLEDAVSLNPQLDPAWNMLGYLYSRANHQEKALTAFKQAIELEPYHPVYRYNYARSLWLTGAYNDALTETKRVNELRDNMAEAYFLHGLILEDLNRNNDAIHSYREAEKRGLADNDFLVRFFKLGTKLESRSDLLRLLEKTKDTDFPDLIRMQGQIRRNSGEYQKALFYYLKLIKQSQYVEADLDHIGQLYCEAGRGLADVKTLGLDESASSRIRSAYENCNSTRKKGPQVRDPVLQPAL